MNATERRIRRRPAGRRILDAVRAAQRCGFTVIDGGGGDAYFFGEGKCCCPLQTLAVVSVSLLELALHGADFVDSASRALDWSPTRSWIFAMGFDGMPVTRASKWLNTEGEATRAEFRRYRHIFDLGRDFRRLLLPEERLIKS